MDQVTEYEATQETAAQETMESMMDQIALSDLRKGEIRTGTVIGETENGWLVDVSYKCEGYLPGKEWSHRILVGDTEKPGVGDSIEVQVVSIREGEEAQLLLSRWRHEFDRRWSEFEDKLAQNEIIQVKGLRKVKGGLMVDCCGLEGFIPISHLSADGRGVNLNKFVGEVFDVKLLEKERKKHRIVFSRKSLVEKEAAEQRAKFYEEVKEGSVIEGEVSSLTDFGVFVNIGAVDGLVHMSEISWKRSVRIKDAYKKGDKVTVKVIGIDRANNRISLSIKQVDGDPWNTVRERIQRGMVLSGPVTNVTDFGAFVEIEPGVEGLIHIGDISWVRIRHPKEVFRKGQEVRAQVLEIDTDKRRISLGFKQLNDPWKDIGDRYKKGQDITVKVVRLADFGAFVEVEDGVEGLIHISQLSTKRVDKPSDVLQEKQEITARVIEVNPEQRRMRLSLSALEERGGGRPPREREEDGGRKRGPARTEHDKQVIPEETTNYTLADLFKDQNISQE
ncbi:MAG: S1 RNA-binding domain-containing protein [Synergistaceae bacterium]|jgi:small subunit ribosomal protein S1|nr:S1 RNA-binding domain-containing protein [Synergistaceae bacterium]